MRIALLILFVISSVVGAENELQPRLPGLLEKLASIDTEYIRKLVDDFHQGIKGVIKSAEAFVDRIHEFYASLLVELAKFLLQVIKFLNFMVNGDWLSAGTSLTYLGMDLLEKTPVVGSVVSNARDVGKAAVDAGRVAVDVGQTAIDVGGKVIGTTTDIITTVRDTTSGVASYFASFLPW